RERSGEIGKDKMVRALEWDAMRQQKMILFEIHYLHFSSGESKMCWGLLSGGRERGRGEPGESAAEGGRETRGGGRAGARERERQREPARMWRCVHMFVILWCSGAVSHNEQPFCSVLFRSEERRVGR